MRRYNPYRDSPYAGMSPEAIEELMERRRNREINNELRAEWEAECREDMKLTNPEDFSDVELGR